MQSEWKPPDIRWVPAAEHAGSVDEKNRARRQCAVYLRLFSRHARKHPGTIVFDLGLHARILAATLRRGPISWQHHNSIQLMGRSLIAAPVRLQVVLSKAIWLARHALSLRFERVSTRPPKLPSPWPPETLNQVFAEIRKAERHINKAVLDEDATAATGHHERLLGLVDLSRKISVRSRYEAEVLLRDVASRSRHLKARRFGKFRYLLRDFCIRLVTPGSQAVTSTEIAERLRVAEEVDREDLAECAKDLRRVIKWLGQGFCRKGTASADAAL